MRNSVLLRKLRLKRARRQMRLLRVGGSEDLFEEAEGVAPEAIVISGLDGEKI